MLSIWIRHWTCPACKEERRQSSHVQSGTWSEKAKSQTCSMYDRHSKGRSNDSRSCKVVWCSSDYAVCIESLSSTSRTSSSRVPRKHPFWNWIRFCKGSEVLLPPYVVTTSIHGKIFSNTNTRTQVLDALTKGFSEGNGNNRFILDARISRVRWARKC